MAVPNKYLISPEAPSIQFTAVDLATRRPVVTLYGIDYKSGSTTSYALISTQKYAQTGTTQTGGSVTTTPDFDCKFTNGLVISGECIVNVPMRIQNAGSIEVSCAVTLKKISGSTTTELATAYGAETKNWNANELRVWGIKLPSFTNKIRGTDTLRLSVRLTSPSGKTIDWFHDPKNRSTLNGVAYSLESSQLAIDIPVVMD